MHHRPVASRLQATLNPPNLPHRSPQQPRRLHLCPFTFEHQRHNLQNIPLTLTHLNPVFLHPLNTNRTFLLG
jgi:hypothetical protein